MNASTSDPQTARPFCGAKKRDGTPCRKYPVAGRSRCRLHGGLSPRGVAHPRFKHGRYNKYLAWMVQEAEVDPVLLSVRADGLGNAARPGPVLHAEPQGSRPRRA